MRQTFWKMLPLELVLVSVLVSVAVSVPVPVSLPVPGPASSLVPTSVSKIFLLTKHI